jgi:signal transduction histidine kinase
VSDDSPNKPPQNALSALARRDYLISAWPWRSLAYTLTSVPVAVIAGLAVAIVALPWFAAVRLTIDGRVPPPLPLVFVMLLVAGLAITCGPLLAIAVGALERRRLSLIDQRPVGSPHRPVNGPARWLQTRFTEPGTWREVAYFAFVGTVVPMAYAMVGLVVVLAVAMVASPFLVGDEHGPISIGADRVSAVHEAVPYALAGLVLLAVTPYLVGLIAAGQAQVARVLLGAGSGGGAQVQEVTRSRERLVDAYEAERRRIERDLHDGAQHRLTSLSLHIGMARLDVPEDSPAAIPLAKAHEQAKELMVVLRDLIHGIRPQALADLGLVGAVRELAAQAALPVTVAAKPWSGPLPERVETTAYFAAAEALANISKHGYAKSADITFSRTGHLLIMEVRDDGRGGADPATGTGLTGLADRVAAVGGRLLLASPAGGPTLVRVELPCDR